MDTNKHPHAENMLLYAQDALTTDKPWERWQFFCHHVGWISLDSHPIWDKIAQYRRKPKMRSLNGHEYPEPERDALEVGTFYWYPAPSIPIYLSVGSSWSGSESDFSLLRRGMVHLSAEAAKAHARAIILAGGGEV